MNVLHVSDTPLSGAPHRLSKALNTYTDVLSKHITWKNKTTTKEFPAEFIGATLTMDELKAMWDWADVVHWHNRVGKTAFLQCTKFDPKSKKGVLQIHSPRESEDFSDALSYKFPLLIIGQYHPRQWPELNYIVPNIVDIFDGNHRAHHADIEHRNTSDVPTVSYAPSSTNGKGWDDKGYSIISPILKRLSLDRKIRYTLIHGRPHNVAMRMKGTSLIGIDEVVTGSYHMSSLEYLSLGIACIANIDPKTEAVIKGLTSADTIPWVKTNKTDFAGCVNHLIKDRDLAMDIGAKSRIWMEQYWNPKVTTLHYKNIYERL